MDAIALGDAVFPVFVHFRGRDFFDFELPCAVVKVCKGVGGDGDEHSGGRPFEHVALAKQAVVETLTCGLKVEAGREILCDAEMGFVGRLDKKALTFGEKTDVIMGGIEADGVEFEAIADHETKADDFGKAAEARMRLAGKERARGQDCRVLGQQPFDPECLDFDGGGVWIFAWIISSFFV